MASASAMNPVRDSDRKKQWRTGETEKTETTEPIHRFGERGGKEAAVVCEGRQNKRQYVVLFH